MSVLPLNHAVWTLAAQPRKINVSLKYYKINNFFIPLNERKGYCESP